MIALIVGRNFKSSATRCVWLYLWHTLLCIAYCLYVIQNGGDAIGYYQSAVLGRVELNFGTAGVNYLTMLMVQGFGLSFLGASLLYNIFGVIGLQAFDASLRYATYDKARKVRLLSTLIVFLPSVSFWSSGIGKDSLAFMAVGVALWATLDLDRRIPLMAFAVAVMLLVRPHMAGAMIIALTLATLFDRRISGGKRLLLGVMATAGSSLMIPFALKYAGVEESVSADVLTGYIEQRQSYNLEGGGGVDIASMNFFMKLFTYLFRPIIFEAKTAAAFAASIDNLILLSLFFIGWRAFLGKGVRVWRENRIFMWVYILVGWGVLASTTANLGIAVRQKWMFVPIIIFLLVSAVGRKREL